MKYFDRKLGPKSMSSAAVLMALVVLTGCEGSLELGGGTVGEDGNYTNPNKSPDTLKPTAYASLHRLNRLEYNNSVRDLLGTTLQPANSFPPDASVGGFDNVSSALNITPALMDRYVDAAHVAVEDAFADRPAFQTRVEEDDPRLSYTIDRDANRIGGIVRLRGGTAQGTISVSTAGSHTLVVRAQGLVNGAAAAPRMRVSLAGQDFDFDVPRAMQEVSFAKELTPGEHPLAVQALNFEENAAENRGNDIMFDYVIVRSDAQVQGPARTLVMVCEPVEPNVESCASTVIQGFAQKAWRRPVSTVESAKLDALFRAVRAEGESVEDSIKLVLRAVLTSVKFLYRFRTIEDADSAQLLDPYVLASRLSYFIWSSTPDDRLLAAAADGTLSTAQGIRQTVQWMLLDSKASALADGFAEQWLDLRHFEQATPSAEIYPEFGPSLHDAMVGESKLFFLDYVNNGEPLATMLRPSFAYRDATLAAHMGLPGPEGDGFQRMPATAADRRGVLALTAWLTSRSDTEHSSPIRRGAWIADNMLCSPVPPPPAGLEIGELAEAESGLTLRERLEQHRNDPSCATCHARLDVLGMGFEMYDGIGRQIDDPSLDSRGDLPSGVSFRGAEQMAQALDPATFVTCVSKKLFTYALGRPAQTADLAQVAELQHSAVTLTLPDLITAIVLSPAFSEPGPLE